MTNEQRERAMMFLLLQSDADIARMVYDLSWAGQRISDPAIRAVCAEHCRNVIAANEKSTSPYAKVNVVSYTDDLNRLLSDTPNGKPVDCPSAIGVTVDSRTYAATTG